MTVMTPKVTRSDPRRLTDPASRSADEQQNFLTEAECRSVFERCLPMADGLPLTVMINSWWSGGVRWARNRAHLADDVWNVDVGIDLGDRHRRVSAFVDRTDDDGLREAMQFAKGAYKYSSNVQHDTRPETQIQWPILKPKLWSDATAAFDGTKRGDVVRRLIESAEQEKLLTAGELVVTSQSHSVQSTFGTSRYYASTHASFSTTVRDTKGTGSGWAGTDDFDVARIDMKALSERALDKCQRSVNPVLLEPGRYTTILEPQAVADLWTPVMRGALQRSTNENPMFNMPFYRSSGRSKIGERVLDPRITVRSDPMDPIGGFLPFSTGYNSQPYEPVSWIDGGVLRQLSYEDFYALPNLGLEKALLNPWSWSMTGGTVSTEEMVATTKRGLLVTRFHGVQVAHIKSQTCTGYTRDGVWLIENGKITKPVKNFRFTESPLFVFNNVEQLGVPKRVLSDSRAYSTVAPTIKVRDFNFSQLADAV